jgi:hypothetical protein
MDAQNPGIEWFQKSGKECLKFTFKGRLTEQMAITAIKKWQEAFRSKPGRKIILIWDCIEMEGYDTAARDQWQNALKAMKDQFDIVWLITPSGIIKMGALIMSQFTSFKLNIASSMSEITL